MMENYITDERTGLKYELVGNYYLIAGDDESEEDRPIGVWGQQHLRYLKEHHRGRYANLLTNGELNAYLADIDRQAEALFLWIDRQRCITEYFRHDYSPFIFRNPCWKASGKMNVFSPIPKVTRMCFCALSILVTAPSPNALCRTMEPSLTSGATNSSCLAAIFAAAEAAGLTPYCAVTEGLSTA